MKLCKECKQREAGEGSSICDLCFIDMKHIRRFFAYDLPAHQRAFRAKHASDGMRRRS